MAVTAPRRIQLQRTAGWRMPPNTVKVHRSTQWGNPWRVGLVTCGCERVCVCGANAFRCETAEQAVDEFKRSTHRAEIRRAEIRLALRGKDLACWCKPGTPCHADVLLEIANG